MVNVAVVIAQYLGETNEQCIHGNRYEISITQGANGTVIVKRSGGNSNCTFTYDSIVQFFNWWTGVETMFSDVFMKRDTRQKKMAV